jgi:osmotically-inducible protein OsmY
MAKRESPAVDQDDLRQGRGGLEPDFGGIGTARSYRGGSWVSQEGTSREGPYVGRGPKGYTRPDANILEDACSRLMHSGHVDATNIEVRVEQGEVTLDGWVVDRRQKRFAEDVVDSVPGVLDVHNRLHVRPRPWRA